MVMGIIVCPGFSHSTQQSIAAGKGVAVLRLLVGFILPTVEADLAIATCCGTPRQGPIDYLPA